MGGVGAEWMAYVCRGGLCMQKTIGPQLIILQGGDGGGSALVVLAVLCVMSFISWGRRPEI